MPLSKTRSTSSAQNSMHQPFKILLVDDDTSSLQLLSQYLQDDYELLVTKNAETVMDIVHNNNPDLILLDIHMPGISGIELAKIVKDDSKTCTIPIIFITGDRDQNTVVEALRSGGDDFISKPIHKQELVKRVEAQIEKIRLQRENLKKEELLIRQHKLAVMGETISMVAHQWRQPLTVLSMTVSNLLDEANDKAPNRQAINDLHDSAQSTIQNLSEVIESFYSFLKPSIGWENVSLLNLLKNSQVFLNQGIKNIGMKVELNVPENIILHCVENEIMQVFTNIIKNTYDEYEAKEISNGILHVDATSDEKRVFIKITDHAGGISKELLPNIFEPYVSTKSCNQTGLGLYMSKIIIEQKMGGTFSVENINDGVCVSIELPLKNRNNQEMEDEVNPNE